MFGWSFGGRKRELAPSGHQTQTSNLLPSRVQKWLHRSDVRAAIQTLLGMLVLLSVTSPPRVWSALTQKEAQVSPVFSVVTFLVVLQPNVGTALFFTAQRLVGVTVGGAVGLVAVYITYAANGVTYTSSLTQGVVIVLLVSIFGFFNALGRFRFPRYWFGFTVAGFSVPFVALIGVHRNDISIEWQIMVFWYLQAALGVAIAALVSTLVLPITAGSSIRTSTCNSIELLGRSTTELLDLMVSSNDTIHENQDQKEVQNVGSGFGVPSLRASQLSEFVEQWALPISTALVKSKSLLDPVTTEIDVYHVPRIFPQAGYDILLSLLRHYLSTLMTLVYLMEDENASLRAVHKLREPLLAVSTSMRASLVAASRLLVPPKRRGKERKDEESGYVKYASVLENELRALEDALVALGRLRLPDIPTATESMDTADGNRNRPGGNFSNETEFTDGEVIMVNTTVAVLFALGSKIRRMYFLLPDIVGAWDKEAYQAWRTHFKGSHLDFGRALYEEIPSPHSPPKSAAYLNEPLPSSPGFTKMVLRRPERRPGKPLHRSKSNRVTIATSTDFEKPGRIKGLLKSLSDLHVPVRQYVTHLLHSGGLTTEHLALSLQTAVALTCASVIHTCNASYMALDGSTIWLVITVVVLAQVTVGGVMVRSINRLIGTAAGGALGLVSLYFVYLTNGLSYENRPNKFIIMTIVLAGFEGILTYKGMQSSHHWAYAWNVCKFTLPIIALSGYASSEFDPKLALWRLLDVTIGVGLDFACAACIFPVSTRAAALRRVRDALQDLSAISADMSVQLLDHRLRAFSGPEKRGRPWLLTRLFGNPQPPTGRKKDITVVVPADTELTSVAEIANEYPLQANHTPNTPKRLPPTRVGPSAIDGDTSPTQLSPREGQDPLQHALWVQKKTLGRPLIELRPLGLDIAAKLSRLAELEVIATFQDKFLPKALSGWTIHAAELTTVRRAIRHALNTFLSFCYVLDGPEMPHILLLAPHRRSIDMVTYHLSECLDSLADIVDIKQRGGSLRGCSSSSAPPVVTDPVSARLDAAQAQLCGLVDEIEASKRPVGCTQADVVLGSAALAVLVATAQAVHDLAEAVVTLAGVRLAVPIHPSISIGHLHSDQFEGSVPLDESKAVEVESTAGLYKAAANGAVLVTSLESPAQQDEVALSRSEMVQGL